MSNQEVPRDLTFVSLLFLVFLTYAIFLASPSLEAGIKNFLISLPTSLIGVSLFALGSKIFDGVKFKIPRTWQEWVVLYFLGLILGGVIIAPIRLAFF